MIIGYHLFNDIFFPDDHGTPSFDAHLMHIYLEVSSHNILTIWAMIMSKLQVTSKEALPKHVDKAGSHIQWVQFLMSSMRSYKSGSMSQSCFVDL